MRTFIAVELSDKQKNKLVELQDELKSAGVDAKFTTREQMHITLRFLGEISEEDAEKVKKDLNECSREKFELELEGMGCFPSNEYIKVVWVGVGKGSEELEEIKKSLDDKIVIGKIDRKHFHAHATLCRVRGARGKEKILGILEKHKGESFGVKEIGEVKLIKSTLMPEGPVYEELYKIILQ